MKIEQHKVPSVSYVLKVKDQVMDQASAEEPLAFIFGVGSMIPGFESNLAGKVKGDNFEFSLQPEDAYGDYNPEAVVDLPIDTFKVDGKINESMLKVGNVVPMQDQNGNPLRGTVKEIADESVKMDFNHMLAGEELHFSGQVVDVRDATKEEIDHGHVHGPGGHQH